MTKLTKTLLALGVAGLVIGGIIDFGGFEVKPVWTAILPLGATFLGLTLITVIMEKAIADDGHEPANKGH